MKIRIRRIGNSDGFILPKELMKRLGIRRGQRFTVVEVSGGGFQLLPNDADFDKALEIADDVIDEYRDTLAALAK